MRILLLFSAVLFLVISPHSLAQPALQPGSILAAADSAVAHMRTVIYNAHRHGISGGGDSYDVAGRIYLARDSNNEVGYKVRMEIKTWAVTYDGHRSLALQPEKKSVTQLDSISTFLQYIDGRTDGGLITMPFRRSPFGDMASDAKYDGIEQVEGTACHAITVAVPDEDMLTGYVLHYYFGVNDHLLRMRRATVQYNGMPMGDTLTITGLQLNVPIADSIFAPAMPSGYTFEIARRPQSEQLPPLAVGTTAPGWTLPDSAGRSVALAELKGRVVVLDFWYIGCPPCVQAIPKLSRLQEQFSQKDVTMIGINISDTPALVERFARARDMRYDVLFDGRSVADKYQVNAYPTMFVIGRDGTIAHVHVGNGEDLEQELGDAIRAAMNEKPK